MSAPRWTLSGRDIRRDGVRIVAAADCMTVPDGEFMTLLRRIVSLLNATELTSDAVAALQVAVTESAASLRSIHISAAADNPIVAVHRESLATLDALTSTLNHTVRMYVELDEEASIALDGGTK